MAPALEEQISLRDECGRSGPQNSIAAPGGWGGRGPGRPDGLRQAAFRARPAAKGRWANVR